MDDVAGGANIPLPQGQRFMTSATAQAPVSIPGSANTLAPTSAALSIARSIVEARDAGEPLRIVGAGTWLNAGHPVDAARSISTSAFVGITEYVPGDLVLTALAGTPLADIDAATASNGQWLPLDPFGSAAGTLGATVATGSAGPLAHANGGPRDLVIGLECVTGAGEIIRGGGRVTKNVAGFDLTRLLVGSWGTLGVITEVSVRLRARPAVEATVALDVPSDVNALRERLAWVRGAPLEALAIELIDAGMARRLDIGDRALLLVRLGGNEASVAAQRLTLSRAGGASELRPEIWDRLRGSEPLGASVWRMSALPSAIAETWAHAQTIVAADTGVMHASVARGIVRCICNLDTAAALAAFGASKFTGTIVHERLPSHLWTTLARPVAADPVSRRIREAFDPHRLLNRGILGDTGE